MAYSALRAGILALLKLPAGPPEPPPGGKVVRIFNASPRYLRYKLVTVFIGALVGLVLAVLLLVGALATGGPLWIAFVVESLFSGVAVFFGYFTARLGFEMRYYILTDRSLRIREGVVFLRESTLTFANVQNLRIRQGPIQQLFGISDVLVDTAGGAGGGKDDDGHKLERGHRGTIQGIENPAEVRDLVMDLLRKYRDAGLGDPDDHAREESVESVERTREVLAEVKAIRKVLTA